MAVFSYKALDNRGRTTKGIIDAESIRVARQKLKAQGIFPTTVEESSGTGRKSPVISLRSSFGGEKKVDTATLGIATRQLATLVAAGMPLVEGLKALGEQLDHATLKRVIAEVSEEVNEGSTLAASMRKYPKAFPKLYANMVASGEASGSLDLVLSRLADLLETQAALKRKISSALMYPALMVVLCFGVIVLLLTYVVPQITQIFASRNAVLPLPTRVVIGMSDMFKAYWPIGLGLMAALALWFSKYRASPKGRKLLDRLLLKLPLVGTLTLKVATSRFSKNLGTMLASGIELLAALGIARNIVGNAVLEEAVDSAIIGVREGGSLSGELERSAVFPRLLIRMIAVGERTGQLEQMLLRAADGYEAEVSSTVASLTSILEPVLILILAVIVGSILSAVMLPMLEMTSLAGV